MSVDEGTVSLPGEEPEPEEPPQPLTCKACGRELKVIARVDGADGSYLSMGCMGKDCPSAQLAQAPDELNVPEQQRITL